jgi:hypothetical protein
MPHTRHGRWGIGHMHNRECAHILIASSPLTNTHDHQTTKTLPPQGHMARQQHPQWQPQRHQQVMTTTHHDAVMTQCRCTTMMACNDGCKQQQLHATTV